ncbi:L-glutamate gamma-semialdehyde dehydrogenase [Desertivirga arenae]|uniref:L-glutamate gamma-semialdehyde dehydrogenase n=1 Tax=Desertivirga arenae TaxID=2810309 RepID=UPI001A97D0A6|nr:L-glutamate gamma-semialdehyde dehydrogenase [Pedobacter sp. SYSU D00823]
MTKAFFKVPSPKNEPVLNYAPGSVERVKIKEALERAYQMNVDLPMYIGAEEVRTGDRIAITPPHNHAQILGYYHRGGTGDVEEAIISALEAKEEWENLPWEQRAAVFLKAADLIAGPYRYEINAATMLGQSKNVYQAEIDSACELVDFLRFNVQYMADIYTQQPPVSPEGSWNRVEQRPLEGFVFALTPFNFTAIAGNLPSCVALMGNVVVWKPADTQIYSAAVIMKVFKEAGLPPGVINLIYVDGPEAGEVIFKHRDFAGIHFTGSTAVFQKIWKTIGENIHLYKSYPRIVGETGGKDFILVHSSANAKASATALVRGAFEYQGQKCSAASRAYISESLWPEIKEFLLEDLQSITVGPVEDFKNFVNAVIDEKSFDKIVSYIEKAKADPDVEVLFGGEYDKSQGYFIQPTIVLVHRPDYVTMCEEIFGPVLSIYLYPDEEYTSILKVIDSTSPYALTGAVLATDRYAIQTATYALRNAAGNFYINDKCTGAVVGQQPFGGARGSGTNDKAGAMLNLLRWVSPRTIKETFNPPKDFRYPFLGSENEH